MSCDIGLQCKPSPFLTARRTQVLSVVHHTITGTRKVRTVGCSNCLARIRRDNQQMRMTGSDKRFYVITTLNSASFSWTIVSPKCNEIQHLATWPKAWPCHRAIHSDHHIDSGVEQAMNNSSSEELSCSYCDESSQVISYHSYPSLAQDHWTHRIQATLTYLQSSHNYPTSIHS